MQILRLTTPKLKSVWGPFPHPSDEDLSPGTPVRKDDRSFYGMGFGDYVMDFGDNTWRQKTS